jgi:maleylpyruvate isomerase
MILYDYWRSSSAWRVRIGLHLKAIAFERRPVNLLAGEQHAPAFRALNPAGQVPVLVLDDDPPGSAPDRPRIITQSLAILGYLEERFPVPALLPGDLWLRARARQMAALMVSGIQPFHNLALLQQLRTMGMADEQALARGFIARGLGALETTARATAGTFLIGGMPGLADACLIPQLYAARRFGVDPSGYPTLTRIEAACAALPPFQAAHANVQSDAPPAPVKS